MNKCLIIVLSTLTKLELSIEMQNVVQKFLIISHGHSPLYLNALNFKIYVPVLSFFFFFFYQLTNFLFTMTNLLNLLSLSNSITRPINFGIINALSRPIIRPRFNYKIWIQNSKSYHDNEAFGYRVPTTEDTMQDC